MFDFSALFDPGHWFDPNPPFPSPIYYFVAAIYLLLLAGGIYLYLVYVRQKFLEHRYKRQIARNVSIWAIVLGVVGLVFLGLRFGTVPWGSMRFLIYVTTLVGLGALAYGIYYWRRNYPQKLRQYEAQVLRNRYAPKPKGRPAPALQRKKKGKKAK